MKLKRLLSIALILLCAGVLWGCSKKAKVDIEPLREYYIQHMEPYAFSKAAVDTFGRPIDTAKMMTNDNMSLQFESGFKTMWIHVTGKPTRDDHTIDFVVTSCSRKGGQIKGTASRIDDKGALLRYSFWSDDITIYFQTLREYKVYSVPDESHATVTVERDLIVAKFARTTPAYFGGGT